jgi:hypothetical protein
MADPPLWRAVARMTEPTGPAVEAPLLRRALFSEALPDAVAMRHLGPHGRREPRRAAGGAGAAADRAGLGPRQALRGPWRAADRLIPADAVVRTAAWHAAPFALHDGIGHLMMLDAGREELADRLIGWLEESFR